MAQSSKSNGGPRRGHRYPSEAELRAVLLARVDKFKRKTGRPWSAIGQAALGDTGWVAGVAHGNNFTVASYAKLMAWLDQNWPKGEPE